MMPKILAAVAATLAVATVAATGNADTSTNPATGDAAATRSTCSAATLKGTYNYFTYGLSTRGRYYRPYFEVGHATYDGHGKVSTVSTNSSRRTTSRQTGTYVLRPNCRGHATYGAKKDPHQIYVDPTGQELSFLLTDPARPEGALGGTETRASTQTQAQMHCSKQTLKGTFAYHARGLKNRKVYVETGFETYDGRGKLTNTYTDSHSPTTTHTSGTYTIADDCTGTARYAGGDVYRLYVAPDGSTFSWLQTKGLDRVGLFGGLEHRISATPNFALTGGSGAAGGGTTDPAMGDAAAAPSACSAATLTGTYNYFIHGLKRRGKSQVPYVEVGHEIYDGDGNVATVATNSLRRTTRRQNGTYVIRANCRGRATYATKQNHHQLYVDPTGQGLSFLLIDRAGVEGSLGGNETRGSTQTRAQLQCSTQTLKGTFAYHASGLKDRRTYVETGFETYDGRGKLTNTYTDSHGRRATHATGTYTIAGDCTGTARYAGGDTYHLYAAPDGTTFSWLQTKGLDRLEYFGGLEHRISATPNHALTGKVLATRPTTRPASATTSSFLRFAGASGTPANLTNPLFVGESVPILLNIDSSYTSYQGALGTSGNEASTLPNASKLVMLTPTFP